MTKKAKRAPRRIGVLGGGPAGLAAALALRRQGFDVLVIDHAAAEDARVGEHLSPQAQPVLRSLGVWDAVRKAAHRDCFGVRAAWGSSDLEENDYFRSVYQSGLNLSRPAFDQLLESAAREAGAEILYETRLVAPTRSGEQCTVSYVQAGVQTTTRLDFLIDASGRAAALATRFGAQRIVYDKLIGLVGILPPGARGRVSQDDGALLIEATQDGWWYGAQLADGRRIATFMTDTDLMQGRGPDQMWRAQLQRSPHLEAFCADDTPLINARSARTQRLDQVAGDGWLAIGDAAMAFDPLSSAGIAKALADGDAVAQTIAATLEGDGEAISRHGLDMKNSFASYISARAAYYRSEQRWPSSLFWQRRQQPFAEEIPITLDPLSLIQANSPQRPISDVVSARFPEIDLGLMLKMSQQAQLAHSLLRSYKSRAQGTPSDHDAIVALQMLISTDVMTIATGPSGNLTSRDADFDEEARL